MRLWDWALEAYARPGVEALCLELQDQDGQCVSFLLWAAWAAIEGRTPDADRLATAAGVARDWEAFVGSPLRAARRGLKRPFAGVAEVEREALRLRLGVEELAAEGLLLEALEALSPPEGGKADLAEALAAAGAAWSPPPPMATIEALAGAFSNG